MLEELFGSRTRVKLLRLFLTHSHQEYFVRELTRTIQEHINSIRRELAHLETLGLIKGFERDRKKFYRVDTTFPLYPELKAMILKSRLTLEKQFISRLQEAGKVYYLSLMGYFVDDPDAIVDLFIVGSLPKKQLEHLLEEFNKQFDREVRFTLISVAEYSYRRDVTDKFLYELLNNPQVIILDKLKSITENPR